MDLKHLKATLQGETYRDLVEFLNTELAQLRDLDNVQEYSKAQDQSIELKAQKKAYKKLRNILEKVMLIAEVSGPVEEKTPADYGLE